MANEKGDTLKGDLEKDTPPETIPKPGEKPKEGQVPPKIFGKYETQEEAEKGFKELESAFGKSQGEKKELEERVREMEAHVEVDSLGRVVGPKKPVGAVSDEEFREKIEEVYREDPIEAMRLLSQAAVTHAAEIFDEIQKQRNETQRIYGKDPNFEELRVAADKLLAGMTPIMKSRPGTDLLAFKMIRGDKLEESLKKTREEIRKEIEAEKVAIEGQRPGEGVTPPPKGKEPTLTKKEEEVAEKLGVSREQFAKRKAEIEGGA